MNKHLLWLVTAIFGPFLLLWHLWPTAVSHAQATPIIINEWSQGNGGSQEWVELLVINGPVDLRGWSLADGNSTQQLQFSQHALWQTVPSGSLLVIYNGNDRDPILPADAAGVTDCTAVLPHSDLAYFSGGWPGLANSNSSDNPRLLDETGTAVHDFSVVPGADWHAGSKKAVGFAGNSITNLTNGDQWLVGDATQASPATGNSPANQDWINSLCQPETPNAVPDLAVMMTGPATAVGGEPLTYAITLTNRGTAPAQGVVLTSTLPRLADYSGDNSGWPQPVSDEGTVVWHVGSVPTQTAVSFHLTTTLWLTASGTVTHIIQVSPVLSETNTTNNQTNHTSDVRSGIQPHILIDAVLYDGYELADADEAVALINLEPYPVTLTGWTLTDGGGGLIELPADVVLPPNQRVWITKNSTAFQRQFGFAPDVVASRWPLLANSGDSVILYDDYGQRADVVVYEGGETEQAGWTGTAVFPYAVTGVFGSEGQILVRQYPITDTNRAADWRQSHKQPLFPGWELDQFRTTTQLTETAVLTVAIAPDNAYELVVAQINSARHSIQIESHTFEHIALGQALTAAASRGVSVTMLLEGGPPGGMDDAQRYNCQQLTAAGGRCRFMISDADQRIADRYRYLHAKFILIDGQRALLGSENLSPNSLPDDPKTDGTWGRRGVVLVTDAPGIVAHLQTIFDYDSDMERYADLFDWQADHETYGRPRPGFVPVTETGGITYAVRYPAPLVLQDSFAFEIVQSPENSLRSDSGLLGLVNQAGRGDMVLVEQLQERPFWGSTNSNATDDPNPRLEAYLAAARRGATVRLLLDSYFNDDRSRVSNSATCATVQRIAQNEHLDLACTLGNPAGLGIHNKMVLVQVDGRGYAHVGSINGSELSSKGNREVALQVQSDEVYGLLREMFWGDWPHTLYLPLVGQDPPRPAAHVLISELLYNPPGADTAEFIELVNPTSLPVDISDWSIGDAVLTTDYEDVRHFPPGTVLEPQQALVVATNGNAFFEEYGRYPDFEILDSGDAVPNLIDNPDWGDPSTFLQLGNQGDELILRRVGGAVVDAVVYGTGAFQELSPCPLVSVGGASLERYPYWRDTDDCSADFREWPFPNPGFVP